MPNSLQKRKEIFAVINRTLKKLYPEISIALQYANDWQLLVAVILSAQTTDKKVNQITAPLFAQYPDVKDFARLSPEKLAQLIHGVNYHNTKARNIIADAHILLDCYGGKIPDTMEELTQLRGVARKTANILLSHIYGKREGIAVDTHVKRLTKLLGLTIYTDPEKIEKDLMQVVPPKEYQNFSLRLIQYGRDYCSARKHNHNNCPLNVALKKK